jgi:hypothetical protein
MIKYEEIVKKQTYSDKQLWELLETYADLRHYLREHLDSVIPLQGGVNTSELAAQMIRVTNEIDGRINNKSKESDGV